MKIKWMPWETYAVVDKSGKVLIAGGGLLGEFKNDPKWIAWLKDWTDWLRQHAKENNWKFVTRTI